jgi:hypothetical protein
MIDSFAKQFRHASLLRDHWGRYLATMYWRHFLTLTFASAVSVGRARHEFVDSFIRRCALVALRSVPWYYALERDAVGDRIHLHALVAGTDLVTVARMEESWTAGQSCIRVYDPTGRAAWYVAKTLGTDAAEYDISKRLPARLAR